MITLGKNGVLVYATRHWLVPPVPGKVIDTTGGGDTFAGRMLEVNIYEVGIRY